MIICAIIFGGWFLYGRKQQENIYKSNFIAIDTKTLTTETDTDSDGLKDWEEILWKTNPSIADTDEDGTDDGTEIKDGRDPTIKGPADTLKRAVSSQTSDLAENLFGFYLNERKTAGDILPGTSEKLVAEALAKASKPNEYSLISEKNIKTNSDNTVAGYKEYGKNIATIMSEVSAQPNEVLILAKALEMKDENVLAELDPSIKMYRKILGEITNTPVPSKLASKHLDLINTTIKVVTDIEGIRGVFSDSLLAFSSITSYSQNIISLESSLRVIGSALKQKGVEYSTDEIGYGLVNVL